MPKAWRSPVASQRTTTPTMSTTFHVSLLSCRKTSRELFLEADKEFVDTLLSFLLLPVGTILHMLTEGDLQGKHLGGISSIYESVNNLECSFLHVDKQTLVEPRPAAVGTCVSTGLLQNAAAPNPSRENIPLPNLYYRCSRGCNNLSTKLGSRCEPCTSQFRTLCTYNTAMTLLPKDLEEQITAVLDVNAPVERASSSTGQGFVRENITYMVTDTLEIMPSTMIRSITVLNKLKVATLSDLESSRITVSIAQVLELLQSALTSSTCLNDVFGKKARK